MEQNLSIREILLKRSKSRQWPYTSSIVMVNRDLPLFDDPQCDYPWLLEVTKGRVCKETPPMVIRYVDGKNLSLDPGYRKRDFYTGLMEVDGDIKTMKRWYSSRARYHYVMGETKMARFYFLRGMISLKTVLYYLTSFITPARKFIVKKFGVFG